MVELGRSAFKNFATPLCIKEFVNTT